MANLVTVVSARTYGYGRRLTLSDGRVGVVQNRWKHGGGRWCYTLRVQ